jgi:uncharacterized protein (UPF0332 family)
VTFDWRAVVGLADELSKRTDEAALRSAISRAYYSAYCYARDRAGLNSAGARDSHKLVFDYYERRAHGKLRDFGSNELPSLHRLRKEADYDEEAKITANQAKLVVGRAKKVIAFIESLRQEEIQKQK